LVPSYFVPLPPAFRSDGVPWTSGFSRFRAFVCPLRIVFFFFSRFLFPSYPMPLVAFPPFWLSKGVVFLMLESLVDVCFFPFLLSTPSPQWLPCDVFCPKRGHTPPFVSVFFSFLLKPPHATPFLLCSFSFYIALCPSPPMGSR